MPTVADFAQEDRVTKADSRDNKLAFDYAWGWFSLHAEQRMQAVNFFLIAIAFLAASYVSAIVGKYPALAAGIAALGAFSSFIFYRIEKRVRGLIKTAEAALRPIEREMAARSGIEEFKIVEQVEATPKGAWSYHKVFSALYGAVGSAFVFGVFYASLDKIKLAQKNMNLLYTPRLAAGLALLLFSYAVVRLGVTHKLKGAGADVDVIQQITRHILAVSAAVAAGIVLMRLGLLN